MRRDRKLSVSLCIFLLRRFNGKEMYKIDAGGRYSFLNDKATVSLRFNDVFNTMKAGFDGANRIRFEDNLHGKANLFT
jgi:hypothetical protein